MKHEKNSKPPKCPIFSLILNFKIRPMGLKKKHESSRQNTSKMQVQISKREPTWTNVKREPTWNMKVHAKSWLRFTSGSRFTSVHVSRGNQTWHVGWGMRVYVYLLPPKKRKLKNPWPLRAWEEMLLRFREQLKPDPICPQKGSKLSRNISHWDFC